MGEAAPDRRTALVTGGARGIGRAIVDNLSQDHNVVLHYHTTPPAGAPSDVLSLRGDLSEDGTAAGLVTKIMERFGRLDVIVNNAGQGTASPLDSVDLSAARQMLNVNLLAPHALLAAALPFLAAGAAVINISSVNALLPPRGAALYGASKAALELWTRGAAKELGPRGIRVNAVAPGPIETVEAPRSDALRAAFLERMALDRLGAPQDIAHAVRFLASDTASFVTGEVLTVSGGYGL